MYHASLYGPVTDAGVITLVLSQEQYALWNEGHWSAYRIEQDVLEQCDALGLRAPVIVLKPDRTPAFAITPPRLHRRTS